MSLYAYDEKTGDFRLFKSERKWRKEITVSVSGIDDIALSRKA